MYKIRIWSLHQLSKREVNTLHTLPYLVAGSRPDEVEFF
jgi:hypothetical protein